MNELFALKHDDILTEFNRYIIEHPGFLKEIPDDALLVFVDPTDPEFSEYNKKRVAVYLKNDELPKRSIIYVDIGELAPIHSRLLNPRILPQNSQWVTT